MTKRTILTSLTESANVHFRPLPCAGSWTTSTRYSATGDRLTSTPARSTWPGDASRVDAPLRWPRVAHEPRRALPARPVGPAQALLRQRGSRLGGHAAAGHADTGADRRPKPCQPVHRGAISCPDLTKSVQHVSSGAFRSIHCGTSSPTHGRACEAFLGHPKPRQGHPRDGAKARSVRHVSLASERRLWTPVPLPAPESLLDPSQRTYGASWRRDRGGTRASGHGRQVPAH